MNALCKEYEKNDNILDIFKVETFIASTGGVCFKELTDAIKEAGLNEKYFNHKTKLVSTKEKSNLKKYAQECVAEYRNKEIEPKIKNEEKASKTKAVNEFNDYYHNRLKNDCSAWCGVYGLFVRSFWAKESKPKSLETIVHHAHDHTLLGYENRTLTTLIHDLKWVKKCGNELAVLNEAPPCFQEAFHDFKNQKPMQKL